MGEDASIEYTISKVASSIVISVTSGLPLVIVPVLSNTTVDILPVLSKISAFFIINPSCAPLPVDTIMATGVARPKAQGHAITITVIA